MPEESKPEERLRKYKKLIAEMAAADGKSPDSLEASIDDFEEVPEEDGSTAPSGPPRDLQSPAKRELEGLAHSRGSRAFGRELRSLSESPEKDRMMLRARELAIQSSLRDIKSRKETLELLLKRKMITRKEYEMRRESIVKEGQALLREKAEIDKKLSS